MANKAYRTFTKQIHADQSDTYTRDLIQQDIQTLNEKLSQATRELSSFDFLNIATAITKVESAQAIINNLVPNSAAIISTSNVFTLNDETFSRGDIIYKTANSNLLKIPAQQSGYFYPKLITQNTNTNNYDISYQLTTESYMDDVGNKEVYKGEGEESDYSFLHPHATMNFKGLESNNANAIYGIVTQNSELQFNQQSTIEGQIIIPIIKCFVENEEVSIQQSILTTIDTSNDKKDWLLQNIPPIVDTIIIK